MNCYLCGRLLWVRPSSGLCDRCAESCEAFYIDLDDDEPRERGPTVPWWAEGSNYSPNE